MDVARAKGVTFGGDKPTPEQQAGTDAFKARQQQNSRMRPEDPTNYHDYLKKNYPGKSFGSEYSPEQRAKRKARGLE